MVNYNPLSGISTMNYTAYVATDAEAIRSVVGDAETTRVDWIPLADVPDLASRGQIPDGPSLLLLSYYLGIQRALRR
jgi:hypothetical protein